MTRDDYDRRLTVKTGQPFFVSIHKKSILKNKNVTKPVPMWWDGM